MREHDLPGPKLIVRHTGQQFSLAEGPVTIGRNEDNRIILADSRASHHHAVIEDRAGTFVVQDLRSANGTLVNGRRVAGIQALRQGDAIRIGDTILDVYLAPGIDPRATVQAIRAAPPGVYTPGDFDTQTQRVGAGWQQASRPGPRWLAIAAGLLAVGLIAAVAILAILLLGQNKTAPAVVVLESPTSSSQASPTAAPPATAEEPGPVEATPKAPATAPSPPEVATEPATEPATETAAEPATSTPSPTPKTPTSTPEDSGPPRPGIITGFEEFGTWRRGAQANGTFVQSSGQVHSGTQAGRLDYNFPSSDNDFVVFLQTFPLEGRPNQITAWVYGDGSGHYLNVWILDAAGETLQFTFGRVQHSGWQQMVAWLRPGDPWPAGHIDGPANGAIDYPISFRALVLDDVPDSFSGSGTIYLDDLGYGEASAPPTPGTAAPIMRFWAENTTISAGEATVLHWHVENVSAIYLDGEPVTGPDGSRRVRPSTTTTYRLRVVYPGGEEVLRVTIAVS